MPEHVTWNSDVQEGAEVGKLIPNSAERTGTGAYPLPVRQVIGSCTDDDGHKYELGRNAFTGEPVIRSVNTDRDWTITWAELLACARACGIDADVCPEKWFNRPAASTEAPHA